MPLLRLEIAQSDRIGFLGLLHSHSSLLKLLDLIRELAFNLLVILVTLVSLNVASFNHVNFLL